MTDDLILLREYARSQSETAFATLVTRYVNLVYSVALRQVCDPHLAEDITQAVFVILAHKADKLGDKTIVPGWLCRTARYASANALTVQQRRQRREQEATMQSFLNSDENLALHNQHDETWPYIAPLLDEAMETLNRKDHDALVLRFFEGKTFTEVGAALGTGEDTARMRVNRALEKLKRFFDRHGISSTTAIIASNISTGSIHTAPAALAKTAIAIGVAKGTATLGISSLTLAKGTLKLMAWTKIKTAMGIGAGILLVSSIAIIALSSRMVAPISPTPTIQKYNGYDDLVRAGAMLSIDNDNVLTSDRAQLGALVSKNASALALARTALSNECHVPVQFTQAYIQNHLDDLIDIKRLARALIAQGRLAEQAGRYQEAADTYFDVIVLGTKAGQGGVIIDELVACAVETIGLAALQSIVDQLDATTCRKTASALEAFDLSGQTWNDVLQQENNWSRQTYPGLRYDIVRWFTRQTIKKMLLRRL